MKIAATSVSMDAARNYTEVDQNNTIWQQGNSAPFPFAQTSRNFSENDFQQNFNTLISSSSTSQQFGTYSSTSKGESTGEVQELDSGDQEKANNSAFSSMVQQITGVAGRVQQVASGGQSRLTTVNSLPVYVGGASLSSSAVHVEQESICFQAQGTVETECGRSISFNMGLQMQREEVSVQSSGFNQLFNVIDPIVLNFEESISMFDQNYFSFDLDGDGSSEEIPQLGSGSGFLALDRNGDGSINDGLEIFGPATGSGFGELAELDSDSNMWIDENDPIFDSLLVWSGAGGEEEQLLSLREAGVGAISVAHLGTQFNLEGDDGETLGVVKANGLYLTEDGEPRSLQEVDLVPRVQEVTQEAGEEVASDSDTDVEVPAAIENLREIIFWQRFKMEMLLGRQQLTPSREEMIDRLEHLTDRLRYAMDENESSSVV